MQNRKTFLADLENKKGLFLQIGLVLALASVWTAFEWKTYQNGPGSLGDLDMVIDDDGWGGGNVFLKSGCLGCAS